MGRQIVIELPYEKDLPMRLVDVKAGDGYSAGRTIEKQIEWLQQTNHGNNDELPDIFACAVALFQLGAGPFEDCFMQSVVWMRG